MLKMFLPSRRRVELGGNGGCGGMVSLLFAAILIGALLFSFRARAEDVCATPAEIMAAITEVPLLTKVEGVSLEALKTQYPGKFPETLELLLIYGPREAALFRTVGFAKGCAQGVGVMSPNVALPLAGEPA